MMRRKLAAVLMALTLGAGVAACDGKGDTEVEGGPGQSTEEDPTLGDPEGGGTPDEGTEDEGGSDMNDGSDEGNPGGSDGAGNGSGTGSGRGDG